MLAERPIVPSSPARWRAAWLAALFAVALLLRLAGTPFGLPELRHIDEVGSVGLVQGMLDRGNLDPHFLKYPVLHFWVQAAAMWLGREAANHLHADASADTAKTFMYLAGRGTSALAGALTVPLAYAAATELWGPAAGLGAAAVVAFAPGHVQHSQFITPEALTGLFVALCLWLGTRGAAAADDRLLVASGFAAGVAAGAKYNGGAVLLAPLALWGTAPPRRWWTVVGIMLAAGAGFAVAMPWMLTNPRGVIEGAFWNLHNYRHTPMPGSDWADNWRFFAVALWRSELTPGPMLLVVLGWMALAVRDRRRALALSVFPVLYYALVASMFRRPLRNLVPLVPALGLFAGYAVARGTTWITARPWSQTQRRLALTLGAVAVFAWPIVRICLYDYFLVRPDTSVEAVAWIRTHLPPHVHLCADPLVPRGPLEGLRVTTLWPEPGLKPYAAEGCEYVVSMASFYGFFAGMLALHAAGYDELFARFPLVAEFGLTPWPWLTDSFPRDALIYRFTIRVNRVVL